LLKFAGKVNANSSAVIRADVETTMHAGWTEAQVEETAHIAALFAAFNRIANGFGLPSPYQDGLLGQIRLNLRIRDITGAEPGKRLRKFHQRRG
jgi:hypothetical protein